MQIANRAISAAFITSLERFLAANEIDIAAIEYVEAADGTPYVFDVNTNTNYNRAAEMRRFGGKACNYGMMAVAAYLGGLLWQESDALNASASSDASTQLQSKTSSDDAGTAPASLADDATSSVDSENADDHLDSSKAFDQVPVVSAVRRRTEQLFKYVSELTE